MFISYAITLFLLGLLALPSLILSRKPDAQKYFDKIAPYQGWIGVIFAIYGLFGIIQCIMNISWLGLGFWFMISWITWLLVAIVEFCLGFILGYGLIQKHALSKNEKAAAKGDQVLKKLMPIQGKMGILAIILGVWMIIVSFI